MDFPNVQPKGGRVAQVNLYTSLYRSKVWMSDIKIDLRAEGFVQSIGWVLGSAMKAFEKYLNVIKTFS